MSNIKYTSDGKKVAVIGKLNASEHIVKEIFVTEDGDEIPSGESFIVKSLHDAPVKSYAERETEKIEQRYREAETKRDTLLRQLEQTNRRYEQKIRMKSAYLKNAVDHLDVSEFDTMIDFLAGDIKYLVTTDFSPKIIPFDEYLFKEDTYSTTMKLISLFGDSEGRFHWRINRYRDGSGSWENFIPCKTEEEAIRVLTENLLGRDRYNRYIIEIAEKYGITLNKEILSQYYETDITQRTYRVKKLKEELKSLEREIKDLKKLSN